MLEGNIPVTHNYSNRKGGLWSSSKVLLKKIYFFHSNLDLQTSKWYFCLTNLHNKIPKGLHEGQLTGSYIWLQQTYKKPLIQLIMKFYYLKCPLWVSVIIHSTKWFRLHLSNRTFYVSLNTYQQEKLIFVIFFKSWWHYYFKRFLFMLVSLFKIMANFQVKTLSNIK